MTKLGGRKDPGDAAAKAEQGHAQKRGLPHAQTRRGRGDAVRAE